MPPSLTEGFVFTVTDLGLFLGKSAVTLRGWDRQGLVTIPRDPSGDRKMSAGQVREIAHAAYDLGRISCDRLKLVLASLTLLELLEKDKT
ncbi:MerR family transcriptional regulator [Candidatus Solirubrobacter pratensis]|uniref:hypothetical protein n=1 Tax=Candidatus Solirubrobacter pratensis TaxID=1298857 RepID=UPI0003F69ACF|nr:hypothetical protein [Candidatus Solirubrobacter pratensis]